MKPTRLEALAVRLTARAVNPMLAFDAKIEYGPIFKGLNTGNFKDRKPAIMEGLKTALKGKTLASDGELNMGHVAKMLDHIEHAAPAKSLDESVSGEQHKAMEAAAHGHSNLGIPKNVGKEFERADKGKSFDKMIRDWAKDKGLTFGDEDFEAMDKMHHDCADEDPENALDGEEETDIEVENAEDEIEEEEGEDGEIEEEEGEDSRRGAKDRKHGKDSKHGKDRKGAMDGKKKVVTADQMEAAIKSAVATERKAGLATSEARDFVRGYVGDLPIALDSAEKVLRSAAKILEIEDAETVHPSALKTLIKTCGRPAGARGGEAFDGAMDSRNGDGGDANALETMFPEAGRIKAVA